MEVKVGWNGYMRRWVILDMKGYEMYQFPDCKNTNLLFPELSKEAASVYTVTTVKKGNNE